mgnify:CR=1 FL=1
MGIESFCYFDESGFIYSLAENQGHEVLAYYNGIEDWEDIDGENYRVAKFDERIDRGRVAEVVEYVVE